MGEGPVDDAVVDGAGISEVREGRFSREGVFGEPVEEGGGAKEAGIGVLRGVDMCICAQ